MPRNVGRSVRETNSVSVEPSLRRTDPPVQEGPADAEVIPSLPGGVRGDQLGCTSDLTASMISVAQDMACRASVSL